MCKECTNDREVQEFEMAFYHGSNFTYLKEFRREIEALHVVHLLFKLESCTHLYLELCRYANKNGLQECAGCGVSLDVLFECKAQDSQNTEVINT